MMMCMIVVLTIIIRIPVPATQGYIHLGDCMIFFSVLLLGRKWGAIAAGMGSAMADFFAGYMQYVPVTLIVKGLMGLAMGFALEYSVDKGLSKVKMKVVEIFSMIIGGLIMVAGYYVAEGFLYGNFIIPLTSVPLNILQFAVGVIIATVLYTAIEKTPAGRQFAYKLPHGPDKR